MGGHVSKWQKEIGKYTRLGGGGGEKRKKKREVDQGWTREEKLTCANQLG
jgi:hypothetical protein